jgi:hypothetical protein
MCSHPNPSPSPTCVHLIQLPLLQEELEHQDQGAHHGPHVHELPHQLCCLQGTCCAPAQSTVIMSMYDATHMGVCACLC